MIVNCTITLKVSPCYDFHKRLFLPKEVTMPAPTNRDSDKFMLRFPDGMRDKIREAAENNGRSMNTEIVARLEASFAASDLNVDKAVQQVVDSTIEKTIEAMIRAGWTRPG
jgi:hypothetical protein